jgi:predicted nucleic acid-binding protein
VSDYFLDSSALLKRYITEPGTAWVLALTTPGNGVNILIAQITPVEVVSGIERQCRAGLFAMADAQGMRLLLDRHARREYRITKLGAVIIVRAKDLLNAYPLRAYDAVQLASALEANARLVGAGSPPLTFVSADTRLLAAAADEGLATEDPNAHR